MFILTQFLFVFSYEITWTNYSFAFPQFIPLIADKTVFSRTFEEFGQILNISIEYNGDNQEQICKFDYQSMEFERQPESLIALVSDMQQIDIDVLKTEEIQQGFSDELISYAIQNWSVILLQKNGTIHHMYYNIGTNFTNYTSHKLQIIIDANTNQQILADKDNYYYVDNQQLIRFKIKDGILEQFKIPNWNKVNGHFKMFIKQSYLYIINGIYGICIYELHNNVIIQVNKLNIEEFQKDKNLIDYAIENDWLYLLDYQSGVYRFNITTMQLDQKFFIDYKGCRMISIKNNQLILIQQNLMHSEVYEGIIIDNDWIMIRKYMAVKQNIKNIQQFNNFALLISNPINNMYQKNLLDNFSDPNISKGTNFYQMEFLGMNELNENYIVGIYKYGVAIYFTQERPAKIFCQAKLSQQNRVTIRLNSTNCLNKNQSDVLNYCQSRLDYVFDIHGVLMSPYQEDLYIYLCIIAFSIVIGLFLAIFFVIRRYQLKKEKIDHLRKSRRSFSY
ncbi:unnamed protein product [Paramecium pentaurelia]|uniref:Transmembrane protein n=1 Tax=Paramecium pentaurelia TaxID=43138 RepID=A0A8S1VJG6_9CILI|nr:unnamed protein product [Paramecium pentaurelia]